MTEEIIDTEISFSSKNFDIVPSVSVANTWFVMRQNGDEVMVQRIGNKFLGINDLKFLERSFFSKLQNLYESAFSLSEKPKTDETE